MKRVLFITYDFPFPTNTGGKNRAYHMLKYAKGDFEKYLFSFVRSDFNVDNVHELEKIGVEVVWTELRRPAKNIKNILGLAFGKSIFKSLYYSPKILEKILEIVITKKIDIIHFESFYTAFFISDAFKQLGAKQIFGTENIEYKLYEEYTAKNVAKFLLPIYQNQVNRIKQEETSLFRKADVCLAVTSDEVDLIKKFNDHVFQIENGIDVEDFKYHKPSRENGKSLLFVGNFTYFPNVEAIESFYKNVFLKLPAEVKLTIIGKKVDTLSFVSDSKVETIEFIPDIKDAYREADILVSPIKIGGGTNFKILEAMAGGVPVIALDKRLEAVGATDGKDVLVAKDDEDYKNKIEDLLADLSKRQRLSENARKFVEEKYSWQVIGKNLSKIWENL